MDTAMALQLDFRTPIFLGVALGILATPAFAGEWRITPLISVNETATDNVDQVENRRTSSLITDISPGINIVGTGDRVKLRFDYQMHNLYYSDDSSRNNIQNSLNAAGTLEALENWFFIDANASISQENISAFRGSTYSNVDANNSNNTVETSTYRLSPYFKGTLGASTDYLLRYNLSKTTSDEGNTFDSSNRELIARFSGVTRFSKLGWSVDASNQKADFDKGRDTEADLVRGVLTYQYDPQFRVSLIGGRESNDYASIDKESHTITGAGFEWAPTDRTQLAASHEDRFFGGSDSISFTHRTSGTAWKYRQTKDVVTSTDQTSATQGTYYSLLDNIIPQSQFNTPADKAAFINAYLLGLGLSPNAQLQGGFMTTGVTLQKRQELSFALLGARNTVTFAATASETEDLSKGLGTDLYAGTDYVYVNNVKQKGVSVNWSHRLTAISTLTGTASRLKSKGRGDSTLDTDENLYTINFVTKLGPQTNAGLGVRRIEVDGDGTTNYTENALIGTFSHRF